MTRSVLLPLDKYRDLLEGVCSSRLLTNNGNLHQRLETELAHYFEVPHVNLFFNGTIALLVALQALSIKNGEVITTLFTFPATPYVLHWNRVTPVFGDIEPGTLNLNPQGFSQLITNNSRAIMPVHVYGIPCDIQGITAVAEEHGLGELCISRAFWAREQAEAPVNSRKIDRKYASDRRSNSTNGRIFASAFLEAEQTFRRIMGYRDLWQLKAYLDELDPTNR